jgi:hypothetical protein
MHSHTVETCPDDLAVLRERLDALAQGGARIVSVVWQPHRADPDQAAAYDASGSFVIVAEQSLEQPLRPRDTLADDILPEVEPLS